MLKESLIKEDESFGGLYYSFLIIFIIAFSSIFAVFTASLNANQVNDKAWYVLLSFSVGPLAIIVATLLFAWLRGDSLVKICGWEKCSSKYYLIAVIAFISVFFGLANLNTSFGNDTRSDKILHHKGAGRKTYKLRPQPVHG